jgi:hypothetical protein
VGRKHFNTSGNFNTSGEGKRSETEGHTRRESALRAGKPVTPDSEAQAQRHSGGIPGSHPVILDFEVVSWEWILNLNATRTGMWQHRSWSWNEVHYAEELDKKKAWVNEPSREQLAADFPQRST